MRTARLLPVSPSMHSSGWGVPVWGVPARGMYLQGGYLPGGVPAKGGCTCPGGVPARVLPPVNRMTDRYKNITLPQTLFAGGNDVFIKYRVVPCDRNMRGTLDEDFYGSGREFGRLEININIYLIILWVETIFTHQLSYNEHPALTSRFLCIKIIDTNGLFTLKVSDSNSNSDCKPNGYIVIYRTFRIAHSQIQIPIPTADYRNGIGIGLESKSASVNVNKPLW